jgi:aminoglycoside phosphotransferase family enzyme/predicted kinase
VTAELCIDELREPRCYPHAPSSVQIIQTHLSVVCLAGDVVYKLKKALTLPFVDFSSIAARRETCRAEVTLNRRLCPDTYLGTTALRRGRDGLSFAAVGDDDSDEDIDVAVVMRRLPQERMLDEMLRRGEATPDHMSQLAGLIARFHRNAARDEATRRHGDPERLRQFAIDNFDELREIKQHGLSVDLLDSLARSCKHDFERIAEELHERAVSSFLVDGHGDLHARNICMTEPPTVYDCIEFEPAFRCGDVATEIAFLTMDLRYRGAPALANTFVAAYVAATGDSRLPALLPTLSSYRAMVRAKVATLSSIGPELSVEDRTGARGSAQRHLLLAGAYSMETRGPWWLLVCGPPASGKSQLAALLAKTVQWPHLATDAIRKQLAGIAPTEQARPEHYSVAFSDQTYADLSQDASEGTASGQRCIMLDGNFATSERRSAAAEAARAVGARLAIAFVDVDLETARQRAAIRVDQPDNISDADADVATRLHGAFEAPAAAEGDVLIKLDGALPSEELAAALMAALCSAGV